MKALVFAGSREIATKWRLFAGILVFLPWLAQQLRAQVFLESDGVVVMEAEDFTASRPTDTHAWFRVPDDASGVGEFSNSRGGYIQGLSLEGDLTGEIHPPLTGAAVEYRFRISTPGVYKLYTRWDGLDVLSNNYFASIVELRDGEEGEADWYQFVRLDESLIDQDFATRPWDNDGFLADDDGFFGPAFWNLQSGEYTLELYIREDGVAVDSVILQLESLDPPTGQGPPASALEREVVEALTSIADTSIVEAAPDTNRGLDDVFGVRSFDSLERSLVKFDISSVPPCNTITRARLVLQSAAGESPGRPIQVFRVDSGWLEFEATWNVGRAETPWLSPGALEDSIGLSGKRGEIPYAAFRDAIVAGDSVSWDVTTLVSEWHREKFVNRGFLLTTDGAGSTLEFFSRESRKRAEIDDDLELLPRLIVEHESVPDCILVVDDTSAEDLAELDEVDGNVIARERGAGDGLDTPNLTSVSGDFIVSRNLPLEFLRAERLAEVSGRVIVEENPRLRSVGIGQLARTGSDLFLGGNGSTVTDGGVSEIELSELRSVGGSLVYSDNYTRSDGGDGIGAGVGTIDLPKLASVGSSFSVTANDTLGAVSAPLLADVGESVEVSSNSSLLSIKLDSLASAGGDLLVLLNGPVSGPPAEGAAAGFSMIELPKLTTIGGKLVFSRNTVLQAIDAPVLTSVVDLVEVSGNASLIDATFASLETIGGDLVVRENSDNGEEIAGGAGFSMIELPKLRTLGGSLLVVQNDGIGSVTLSALEIVGAEVQVSGNLALAVLTLDSLESTGGSLVISGNVADGDDQAGSGLSSVELPTLESVGGTLEVTENDLLQSISADLLTIVAGDVDISRNDGLSAISLATLESTGGDFLLADNGSDSPVGAGAGFSMIELPKLATVGGRFVVASNEALGAFEASGLVSIDGDWTVSNQPNLYSLKAESLESVGGQLTIVGNGTLADGGAGFSMIELPKLRTVGGGLLFAENDGFGSFEAVSLESVGGDLIIDGGSSLVTLSLGASLSVAGDVSISTRGAPSLDLRGVDAAGSLVVRALGATSLAVTLPTGDADLLLSSDETLTTLAGPEQGAGLPVERTESSVRLTVGANGEADRGDVTLEILDGESLSPAEAISEDGAGMKVDPFVVVSLDTAVEALDDGARLDFTIDLVSSTERGRILEALRAGTLTIAERTVTLDNPYRVRVPCIADPEDTVDSCASIRLFDEDGAEVTLEAAEEAASVVVEASVDAPGVYAVVDSGFVLAQFRRGDSNSDGILDISDPISVFFFLYEPSFQIGCADAADADNDGVVTLTDGVRIIMWLLRGEPEPEAPGPFSCGPDRDDDDLDCEVLGPCP